MSDAASARMEKARRAQAQWAQRSVHQRCRALKPLRIAIASRIDEIVAVISEEVGKPPLDVLSGDIMVTLEQLRFYEQAAPRILRSHAIGKPWFFFTGTRFTESFEPHGAALIFAPWNYPFQLSVIPMATALFTGNAVVLKCSERTPRTAALIASICKQADLPDGLVQVSCEPPNEATTLIDAHPDLIFFTGSVHNGRTIAQQAASYLIPAVLELGGKDACLVFASSDLARAVEGAVYGAFANAGQVCVGTKRIYVEHSIYADFLHRFVERVSSLRVGTDLNSDISLVRFTSVRELLMEQVNDALARGATLHTPWQRNSDHVPPLVLTDVPPESLLLTEESFGPVVCIAPFKEEAEAVRLANSTHFALSASIFTGDSAQGRSIAAQLTAGSCAINDVIRNIGNPQASFGGNAASGHGRYHGATGLRTFSRIKSVMTVLRPRNPEVHWFPLTARTFQRLRALLLFRHTTGSFARRMKNLLPLLALIATLSASALTQTSAPPLSLDITFPPGNHGTTIAYLLFSSANGFPGDVHKASRHEFVPVVSPEATHQRIELGPIATGRYAVAVYLDLNGNHKLDQGFLGIPKEPVGVSNHPKSHMGPPRFNECSFIHNPNAQVVPITLVK